MTTISRTAGQPVIHGAMGGFFRLLGKWVNGIVTYLARRHAIQTLSELDLDISAARINTEKGAAIDSFYVRELDGGKILSPERHRAIERKLRQAIHSLDR